MLAVFALSAIAVLILKKTLNLYSHKNTNTVYVSHSVAWFVSPLIDFKFIPILTQFGQLQQ